MAAKRAVEVLPVPEGATLGWLAVNYSCLGTFVKRDLAIACARFTRAPQIFLYESPLGFFIAFETSQLLPPARK